MTVIPMQAPGARPPQVDTQIAYEALVPQFAHSADLLARKAGMSSSAAESKDFADAALKLAQAIITLDPDRLAGGDTAEARKASMPDHPEAGALAKPKTGDSDHDGRVGE